MPKPKIDRIKMNQLLKSGKSQKDVAQFFGVSEGAISKAKKELNISVVKDVALQTAHQVVASELDVVTQLRKINDKANAILDDLMSKIENEKETSERKKDLREIALKSMQEIRNQLCLQLDIMKTLYDVTAIAEFQKEVLETIGECEPQARIRIIERLKQRKALCQSVEVR